MSDPDGHSSAVEVAVRRLRLDSADDKALCETFECGTEEWEVQVSDFIVRKVWLPGRDPERTLLATEIPSGAIVGFGATKITTVELPQLAAPISVIRVCYFGVGTPFKGAVDAEGRKLASRLYSTVELDARTQPSAADMPFELFCDGRNDRGLRFWTDPLRGYEIIGSAYGHLLRLVRMPPP